MKLHRSRTSLHVVAFVATAVILLSLGAPTHLLGAGPDFGTFTWNKSKMTMVDAYAFQKPDSFDKTKKVTVVVLATVKLDRAKIDGELDRESAIDSLVSDGEGTSVQLSFGDDGSLNSLNAQIRTDGKYQSISTSGSLKADLKANTTERIAGRVQSGGTKTFSTDKYAYDFTFDIPVTPGLPPGKPLPAGGGEAGKAYVAYVAALQKGDVDTVAKYWPKDRADQLLAARKDPDFKEKFGMLKLFGPKSVTVKGGTLRDTVADLDVVGKDADGNVMDGPVRMVKEGTTWKLGKENLTTHTK